MTSTDYYPSVRKTGTMIYSISPTRKVRIRFRALRDYWVCIANQCEQHRVHNWPTWTYVRTFRAEYSGALLDDFTQSIAQWLAEHWDDAYHGELGLWQATGLDGEIPGWPDSAEKGQSDAG